MVKAIGIVASPGTGKSTLIPLVAQLLTKGRSCPVVSLDNEHFGMLPDSRVKLALEMGYSSPDSPQFRASVGRLILFDTIYSMGRHMSQYPDDSIALIHIPDKDPEVKIEGIPVFTKFQEQYEAAGLNVVTFVGLVLDGTENEYITQMRARFDSRKALSTCQEQLDDPKREENDLLFRRNCVMKMNQFGYKVIHLSRRDSFSDAAECISSELKSFL
jgi:hypothetical protein